MSASFIRIRTRAAPLSPLLHRTVGAAGAATAVTVALRFSGLGCSLLVSMSKYSPSGPCRASGSLCFRRSSEPWPSHSSSPTSISASSSPSPSRSPSTAPGVPWHLRHARTVGGGGGKQCETAHAAPSSATLRHGTGRPAAFHWGPSGLKHPILAVVILCMCAGGCAIAQCRCAVCQG